MKIKFICDKCNHKWMQTYKLFSDINWNCPKCKNSKEVFSLTGDKK